MNEFNLKAIELKFNIDTIRILREQNKTNEQITSILKNEIKYPNELINILLNINKEFVNSFLCGIKYRLPSYSKNELKYILINENDYLTPLIEYLFGDNLKYYDHLTQNNYNDQLHNLFLKSINGTKIDVANVVYECYKDKFVCASIKNKIWYEFKNHKWEFIEDAYTLDQTLAIDFVKKYQLFIDDIKLKSHNNYNDEYTNKLIFLTNNVISKLQTKKDRLELINLCTNTFYDSSFYHSLNENNCLLCFNNGVFDLDKKNFRNGEYNDYISFSTKLNYIPYDNINPDTKNLLNNILTSILPNNELRTYLLNFLSTSLYGKLFNRKFNIWNGNFDTGLTYLIQLIKFSLGDYVLNLNNDILYSKVTNSKFDSELSKTKGKRLCIFDEIEDYTNKSSTKMINKIINNNILNNINFDVDFTSQFNTILPCNSLPTFRNIKDTHFNYIYVLNFDTKYNKPIYNTELYECFISLLIHNFINYNQTDLIIPNDVIKYTISYNHGIFNDFNSYCITLNNDNNSNTSIDDIYQLFLIWYNKFNTIDTTNNIPKDYNNLPAINDIRKYIENLYGKSNKLIWSNISLKKIE